MFYTGSDLTWTQCVPCINCYNQKNPFYDPTQSSTFTTIECNNTGFHGHIDGFLGLGRGSLSIISQASNMYNNIFSYCLLSRINKVGYLELGSPALGVKYTPILTNLKKPSFYFLNLTSIFIWGERIELSPTIFSCPGTILDSGTTFTRFPYVIKIGLGTPTKDFTVMFDTGSDLTWTQCIPCINCYNKKNPFYDPTQSSTFTTIECISDYCTQLPLFRCSSTFTCIYEVRYADHNITKGSLINDTLKFSNDNIPNFHFGCGDNNTRFHGQMDGFLGLGRGALSIISQASNMYNNIFSYCLPSRIDKVGYLELGSPALGVKYTPMLTNPKMPSFYFLNLTAIFIWG
ncbi:Aspartic proteinase nepenthesin-1 [Dendrobium catenatum]|uniref:Aspartic proteinase nepenthesin-1 n=1 Tax=Dendrobium catenatum TaxID=906689 RepID=A0A2I0V790_9ASPA|nr:Aspartic proteinase nepenthesin-1 [Dendrobium catenatum]